MKAEECVEAWVVWAAADLAAAPPAAVADAAVAEVAELVAAVKRSAIALTSRLTFRTFLTTQISAGR